MRIIGDGDVGAGVIGRRVAEPDGVADLVGQDLVAVGVQHRGGVVAEAVVDPHIALDRAEGRIAGQIGKGRRALGPVGIVAEQDRRIVGIIAAGVGHLLEGDARHIRPRLKGEKRGRDLGLGELGKAGRLLGHGTRCRRPEGKGHSHTLAQSRPGQAGAGDLGTRVDRAQRRLAVGAEPAALVAVQDDRLPVTAVAKVDGAVETTAAGAQAVARDRAKGGIGVVVRRGVFHEPARVTGAAEDRKRGRLTTGEQGVEHGKAPHMNIRQIP